MEQCGCVALTEAPMRRILTVVGITLLLVGCATEPSDLMKRYDEARSKFVAHRDRLNRGYCRHSPVERRKIAYRTWLAERNKPGSPYGSEVGVWADLEVACGEANREG